MSAVVNVAVPVFAIILCGFIAGRYRILGEAAGQALNNFVYWFALPPLLFVAMARVPVEAIFNGPFLLTFTGGILGTVALSFVVGMLFFPGRLSMLSLQAMTATFANTGYMGVPLFLTAFGEERVLPALILTVYNSAIMVGGAVILVEIDLARGRPLEIMGRVGLALVKNPLVVTPVLGVVYSAAGLPLPASLVAFCEILGASAGPCALFAMGLFLVGRSITAGLGEVSWIVLLKLAVQPALTFWLGSMLLADRPFWLASAVILSALPTGALAFVLAQRYEVYVQRSTSVILVSTVLSVVTLSGLLIWFDL